MSAGPDPAFSITTFDDTVVTDFTVVCVPNTVTFEALSCPTTVNGPDIVPPVNSKAFAADAYTVARADALAAVVVLALFVADVMHPPLNAFAVTFPKIASPVTVNGPDTVPPVFGKAFAADADTVARADALAAVVALVLSSADEMHPPVNAAADSVPVMNPSPNTDNDDARIVSNAPALTPVIVGADRLLFIR